MECEAECGQADLHAERHSEERRKVHITEVNGEGALCGSSCIGVKDNVTQSANGTYDSSVDRTNLQKEVDALRTEIDRIADSANFNGIKLLDGSQAGTKAQAAWTEPGPRRWR